MHEDHEKIIQLLLQEDRSNVDLGLQLLQGLTEYRDVVVLAFLRCLIKMSYPSFKIFKHRLNKIGNWHISYPSQDYSPSRSKYKGKVIIKLMNWNDEAGRHWGVDYGSPTMVIEKVGIKHTSKVENMDIEIRSLFELKTETKQLGEPYYGARYLYNNHHALMMFATVFSGT